MSKQIICGLKFTHDAAVAVIEDGTLRFCTEIEKTANRPRYAAMPDDGGALIAEVLAREGVSPDDVTRWVIDGWKGGYIPSHALAVARYHEGDSSADVAGRPMAALHVYGTRMYNSHTHNAGHVWGAYCTSPFAAERRAANVLVWDGGQNPRLYRVDPMAGRYDRMRFQGCLHDVYGHMYAVMGSYFGPFADRDVPRRAMRAVQGEHPFELWLDRYDTPGKLMSYIAHGEVHQGMITHLHGAYYRCGGRHQWQARHNYNRTGELEHRLCLSVMRYCHRNGIYAPTALRSIHEWLQELLLTTLKESTAPGEPLIFCGGSALNIKWNSALRGSGHFAEVWVPPFPNDAGSALGAACAEMVTYGPEVALEWDVYSGPRLEPTASSDVPEGWEVQDGFDAVQLALLIAARQEPVVVLNGRAELGPRALGHRSILAPANNFRIKEVLNDIKGREPWRPVAPICLEEHAADYFLPGTRDPYMLFDHHMKLEAQEQFPAVAHMDGTARLQTVGRDGSPFVRTVLEAYCAATREPMLCNTSANLNGSGFFPSARAAMEWGQTRYVWADDTLYTNLNFKGYAS